MTIRTVLAEGVRERVVNTVRRVLALDILDLAAGRRGKTTVMRSSLRKGRNAPVFITPLFGATHFFATDFVGVGFFGFAALDFVAFLVDDLLCDFFDFVCAVAAVGAAIKMPAIAIAARIVQFCFRFIWELRVR